MLRTYHTYLERVPFSEPETDRLWNGDSSDRANGQVTRAAMNPYERRCIKNRHAVNCDFPWQRARQKWIIDTPLSPFRLN